MTDVKKVQKKVEDKSIRDIENIIPSCDVLVLPSFSESFGLALIEVLACRKPVIGNYVGDITEIIAEDMGLLVNPNKVSSIAGEIDEVINDEQLGFTLLTSNAWDRAIKFSKIDIPYDEV